MVCGEICVVSAVHVTKNRCRSPLRVGSTCNVGQKLATFAHVGEMSPTCRRHVELRRYESPTDSVRICYCVCWSAGDVAIQAAD